MHSCGAVMCSNQRTQNFAQNIMKLNQKHYLNDLISCYIRSENKNKSVKGELDFIHGSTNINLLFSPHTLVFQK
jgi:hypothetical protein